jgi:hypothetical protein
LRAVSGLPMMAVHRAGPRTHLSRSKEYGNLDKDELTAWALKNGWQMLGGHPSLTNAVRPKEPIVRLVLKATVANVEIKRPAGKWEKVAGTSYDQIRPDPNTGIPRGLGLVSTTGFTKLMQENKDRQTFSNFG